MYVQNASTAQGAQSAQQQMFGYQSPGGYINIAPQGGGGGGGGGGAPSAPNLSYMNPQFVNSFTKGLQNQWNGALQANQAQLAQMMGLANSYGQGQLGYSNQLTQQQQAEGQQTMAQRGLYNSTVAQGVNQAAQNAGALRNNQINDQMTQLKLGVLGQNTIQYPNLGAYAQLASQPGAFSGNSPYSAMMGAMSKLNFGGGAPAGGGGGGGMAMMAAGGR